MTSPTPTFDPYAPPKSNINQEPTAIGTTQPRYFVLSTRVLVALVPLTVGLFGLYWFYRQWAAARQSGEKVRPVGRAIFSIFFIHALFRAIQFSRVQAGLAAGRAQSGMASLYIVLAILSNLVSRIELASAFLISVVFSLGEGMVLSLAQRDVNELAEKTGNASNHGIGVGGILLTLLGVVLFVFALVGTLSLFAP